MGYLPPEPPRRNDGPPICGDDVCWDEGGLFRFVGHVEALHSGDAMILLYGLAGNHINRYFYVSEKYLLAAFKRQAHK